MALFAIYKIIKPIIRDATKVRLKSFAMKAKLQRVENFPMLRFGKISVHLKSHFAFGVLLAFGCHFKVQFSFLKKWKRER